MSQILNRTSVRFGPEIRSVPIRFRSRTKPEPASARRTRAFACRTETNRNAVRPTARNRRKSVCGRKSIAFDRLLIYVKGTYALIRVVIRYDLLRLDRLLALPGSVDRECLPAPYRSRPVRLSTNPNRRPTMKWSRHFRTTKTRLLVSRNNVVPAADRFLSF